MRPWLKGFMMLILSTVALSLPALADDDCKQGSTMEREGQTYRVTLDPSKSSLTLLDDGKYEHTTVKPYMSPEPKGGKKRSLAVVLYWFRGKVTSTEAVERFLELGMRPLTGHEALAFGAQNPDVQRRYPLAAIGRAYVVGGESKFLQLVGLRDGRGAMFVETDCLPGGKKGGVRFLATKKEGVR